jgi:hypothetical protein
LTTSGANNATNFNFQPDVHENHIFFIGSAMAQSKTNDLDVYQPRNPKVSAYYYRCVENHFEELEQNWDDKYASRYGFWRRYIMTIIGLGHNIGHSGEGSGLRY